MSATVNRLSAGLMTPLQLLYIITVFNKSNNKGRCIAARYVIMFVTFLKRGQLQQLKVARALESKFRTNTWTV